MKEQHHKSIGAWLPAELLYNKEITPRQKLLYATIHNLCNQKGYCWATNAYFASEFAINARSVQRDIVVLKDAGYINSELIPNANGDERRLRIPVGGDTGVMGGGVMGVTHKNININKTNGKSIDLPSVQKVIDNNNKTIAKMPKSVGGKQVSIDEVNLAVEFVSEYNKTRSVYMRVRKLRPEGYEGTLSFDGKSCRQLIELIRAEYTAFDFFEAVSQAFEEPFHYDQQNFFKYIKPDYITRMGTFQKYYELSQSEMALTK